MNQYDFEKKAIIVTGAGGMLGSALCIELIRRNARVMAWDISDEALENLKESVKSEFKSLKSLVSRKINICLHTEIIQAVEELIDQDEHLIALINNAANNPKVERNGWADSDVENFDMTSWAQDLDVGLTGTFNCSRIVGSKMVKSGEQCSILNISSDLGLIAPNQSLYKNEHGVVLHKPASYSAVKHGVNGLTKYFSTYWAGENIRCNSICPGGIYANQDAEFVKKLSRLIPMGRMAKLEEIVNASIFLISREAAYMNGAIVPVDGGRTAW